jgi:hypothetical protein
VSSSGSGCSGSLVPALLNRITVLIKQMLMHPGSSRFFELIDKYLHHSASEEETAELFLLLQSHVHDEELEQHIEQSWDAEKKGIAGTQ